MKTYFIISLIFNNLIKLVDSQHGTVGRPCEVSTDCGTGNYCAGNKRCACLTTYVEIDSYCWRSNYFINKQIFLGSTLARGGG